jgi:hypothetical protein
MQLVLVYSQPLALIHNQSLGVALKPDETYAIQMSLFIPKDIKERYQTVMFRLRDNEGNFLGQPMIAFIKVKKPADSSVSSSLA